LARSHPDARCGSDKSELTETDTFWNRVNPRNEFVRRSNQDNPIGCYCPLAGLGERVSPINFIGIPIYFIGSKAQTSSMAYSK
jgi:hypothetical protein